MKLVFDDNMRDRIFNFFIEQRKDFSLLEFKKFCVSALYFRITKNTDLLISLNTAISEKFMDEYKQMKVNDIIPIYRCQVKGPTLQN